MEGDKAMRTLRVPQTWFLTIGSAVIISFSELSSKEMACNNIQLDRMAPGSTPGIYTIRVVDNASMCRYHIVIDRDCNYVNFLKRATALARSGEAHLNTYELFDEQGGLVDPRTWLSLLSSGDVESHIFALRSKGVDETEQESNEFRALSMKLLEAGRGDSHDSGFHPPIREMQLVRYPTKESRPSTIHGSLPGHLIPATRRLSLTKIPELYDVSANTSTMRYGYQNETPYGKQFATPETGRAGIMPRNTNSVNGKLLLGPSPALSRKDSPVHQEWGFVHLTAPSRYKAVSSLEAENDQQSWSSGPKSAPPLPFDDEDMDSLDDFGPGQDADHEDPGLPPEKLQRHQSLAHSITSSIVEDRLVPFLTWRLSRDTDDRSAEETDKTLVQLLNKIHGSLASGSYGKLYLEAFQCTRQDVVERSQTLCSILGEQSAASTSREAGTAEDTNPYQQQINISAAHTKSTLFRTLLEVSEEIFAAFLPTSGSSSAHPLCGRFWGTLDLILRQIYLSSTTSRHFHEPNWVEIPPFLSPIQGEGRTESSTKKTSSQECSACRQNTMYSSLESAIGHIHSEHIQCQHAFQGTKIFDDPCLGWVRRQGLDVEADGEVLTTASALVATLVNIRDKTRDLHCSVSGSSESNKTTDCRPHLLSNLVYSFEEIVWKYVLTAKELLWTNRARLRNWERGLALPMPKPLTMIRDWSKSTEEKIQEYLGLAKRDIIILGTTRGDVDRLIIAPVGPEFIVASLISNIQNHTILQGTGQKMEIAKHYRKVSLGLRFGATRDPKRRRFLEISALEEELEALRTVAQVQTQLIRAYRKVLEPTAFQSATTDWAYLKDRQAMYPLEKKRLDLQDQKLADDKVLEEGHGKAIRVFTFVTLFFLPLSFVTSFFGMNTTDVRDTDWDQRIFWSSAVPVTVFVLTLAIIYGYKWDVVVDAFSNALASQKSPELCDVLEDSITPLVGDKPSGNEKPAIPHSAQIPFATLAKGFGQAMKRRQAPENNEAVLRRQTNDSLLV
ncbi:hypothetical protein BKA56DRAFT_678796 [Ilyonectria sp. MPI-CAGE-AT-0026]|nr:hypothetical protein BKA56DRAFT_678796 [Ilyonectria sp. MPI-CAGE-AT-0026]